MNIDLDVDRNESTAVVTFDVSVIPHEIRSGAFSEMRTVPPDDVINAARSLLTRVFHDGDAIVYAQIKFMSIDAALRAVEMMKNSWA